MIKLRKIIDENTMDVSLSSGSENEGGVEGLEANESGKKSSQSEKTRTI